MDYAGRFLCRRKLRVGQKALDHWIDNAKDSMSA
jgi:hypothetical protein